ncbi:hypothetical protein HOLleu_01104 [Holothuria leucospilota]|uniref:DUF4371 domain-containing protein n=1 Tax=Holothuria leucospilota TaxID=206669 RepID=A0A9Q1HKM9_HOLLE|nr:hypothetical protein HOLleu_01104 [Holothuria leucospilota]
MAKGKAGSLDAWLGKSTDKDTGESSKSSGGTQEKGTSKFSKHSISFNDTWIVGRENCKLCQKHNSHGKKGTWTKVPCVRLREEAVKEHSNSSAHKNAEVAEREMKLVAARKGDITNCFKGVVSAQEEAVICAMKCLYWITKEELPFTTKLESLKSFAVDHLGCVTLKNLNLSKNANYTSDQIKQEFLESMATPLLQDIKRSVSNSPVFGLICDESMDISVKS